jgi:hypothetical protein
VNVKKIEANNDEIFTAHLEVLLLKVSLKVCQMDSLTKKKNKQLANESNENYKIITLLQQIFSNAARYTEVFGKKN